MSRQAPVDASLEQTFAALPWLRQESVRDRKGRPAPVVWAMAAKFGPGDYDRVGETYLGVDNVRSTRVSTVWLGPIAPFDFETMTFSDNPDLDQWQWRWPTLRAAEIGHRRTVRLVKFALHRRVPLAKAHRRGRW